MTGALQRDHDAKAQRILGHLKAHLRYDNGHLPRPFFVELTGSPSAGKTTTITELYKYLRRLGFRVLRPQEGAEVIQHIPRSTPVYNVRTAIYAWTILVDESFKHTYDIILLDRGLFDAYGWMMYWKDKGELTDEQQRIVQSFFLMPFWLDSIDAAYIMVCDPEEAMRREMRIALSQRMGETTNPTAIAKLIDRYSRAYERLKDSHPQLELVNTTHLQEQEMVDLIAGKILDTLDAKVKEA